MSNQIDSRVVEMRFENGQFERGIQSTLRSLADLAKGLKLDGATKGLQDVSAAGKNVKLDHIASDVQTIASRFSAMSVAGIAALGAIAVKAVEVGGQVAKALTIKPLLDGFSDYELKIGATQTIMAGTGESIGFVTDQLKELDIYADQTIYSLSDMVGNIGKFTNAGVDLETAVGAMKGISNVAAVSGASTGEAARAMYNLGQAIGQGTVKLMDWRSVELANMGTKEFKEQLIQSAVAMGTLERAADGTTRTTSGTEVSFKNFSSTLSEGWLTAEALTDTLGRYADETTEIGKKAYAAAKDVKSFSMMIDTLKAAAGTGWTDTLDIVIGNLPEAKEMFTDLSNTLGGMLQSSSDARNQLLGDWKELGGRTALIDTVKNAFAALVSVVTPIKEAFRSIFPATTAEQLFKLTTTIRDFAAGLKIGGETADRLKRTFAGVFAIFGIGWEIIKQLASALAELFGHVTEGESGFLKITAGVGDFLVALHEAIKNGEGLSNFFRGLVDILEKPIDLVKRLGSAFLSLFDGIGGGSVDDLSAKFEPFSALGKTVSTIWSNVMDKLGEVWNFFFDMSSRLAGAFGGLGEQISGMFEGVSFDQVLSILNTGLLAVIALAIRNFLGSMGDAAGGLGDLISNITSPFNELTGTLKSMQNTLRAATLLQIAAAVGILTMSVIGLSKVDGEGLKRALTAMTVMFVQLTVAMAVFQKIDIKSGMFQLILLAGALRILTSAVVALAELDLGELARGLGGAAVGIGLLVAAANLMPDGKKMISSSLGLILLASAVKLLASAVEDLSGLDWEELGKGLVGVGGLLAALTLFTRFAAANKGGIAQGLGIILLAAGIKILASAMEDFAQFSWDEIGRGLTAMGGGLALMSAALMLIPPSSILSAAAILIVASSLGMIGDALADMGKMSWSEVARGMTSLAGALVLIAGALALLPPSSLLSAAAIFVVASSLSMITDALTLMGGMTWEEIAKGLITLAGALTIIAVAMGAMTTAIFGATALLVVSASLAILAPILQMFGGMSWEEIGKGLLMLAGVFVVLGLAGLVLTPVIPTLLGLGVAITLLGVGMLAAGAGLLLFSTGLTALAVAGAAGTAAIVGIVAGLIGLIPMVMEQIGLGLVAFAGVIAAAGPAITEAIVVVLESLLDAIIRLSPKIVQTLEVMLGLMLDALQRSVPKMVTAGLNILVGVLNGIANNIGRVIDSATNLIVNFINGIARNLPRVIQAGINLIISFVNGLADGIRNNQARMEAAGRNLADAIIDGIVSGLTSGIGNVTRKAREVARAALDAAKSFLGIRSPSREFMKIGAYSTEGLAKGLEDSGMVTKAAEHVGRDAIFAMQKTLTSLSSILDKEIDANPTIRPVLDLSDIQRDAGRIGTMLASRPIAVGSTYSTASAASAGYRANQAAFSESADVTTASGDSITFIQNNNSPKALSNAEIYRNTKNQLSVAKGALKKS